MVRASYQCITGAGALPGGRAAIDGLLPPRESVPRTPGPFEHPMTREHDDLLSRNLSALASRDRVRAERLCLPVANDRVVPGPDGRPHLRYHGTLIALPVDEAVVQGVADSVPANGEPVLFGLGLGELALKLLLRPDLPNVTIYERDPWLIRLFLSRVDCGRSLNSGRLRLRFASDFVEELPRWRKRPVLEHPVLGPIYDMERTILREGLKDRRVLVVDGGLLVAELSDELRRLGWSVLPWEVTLLAVEELELVAETTRPDAVFAVNLVQGLAEACARTRLPLIVWEIDPRLDPLHRVDASTRGCHIFCWRRERITDFRRAGFVHVHYLPLAASPERGAQGEPTAAEVERYAAPLTFVGSSMVANGHDCRRQFLDLYGLWAGGDPEAGRAEGEALLDEALTLQQAEYDRYILPDELEARMPGFLSAMRRRSDVPDPVSLAAEMAAADRRIFIVANLGQVGVRVWGDEGWKVTEEHGVRYRGPAGHRVEISRIYRLGGLQIDIGRIYQRDIVTLRVFEALASGGFVLAEDNEALRELFDVGAEIVAWSTVEELFEKVEHFLAHPEEAAVIAQRGQARVLREHTITHRVAAMLSAASITAPTAVARA